MTQIAWIDLAALLERAGFPAGVPMATGMAVVASESGRDPAATNVVNNTPPSTDRGLWQINSYWHPEVTDAMAFDPLLASKEALRISKNGSDYSPWAAYTGGNYKSHYEAAVVAMDAWSRIKALNTKIASQTSTIAAKDTTIQQLTAERDALKATVAQYVASTDALNAKVSGLQSDLNTLNQDYSDLHQKYSALLGKVNDYVAMIKSSLLP